MRKNPLRMEGKAGTVTHDAALQKVRMLNHLADRLNIVATVSYNLERMLLYIHFAPDTPLSFYSFGQLASGMAKLSLRSPIIQFRDNMVVCAM